MLNVAAEYTDNRPCKSQRVTQAAAIGGASLVGGLLWAGAARASEMARDAANIGTANRIGLALGAGNDALSRALPEPSGCDCS